MCVTPVPLKMETLKWKARKYMLPQKSDIINVPCGKCYECRRSQVNQWVFRINNEFKAKTTKRAYFITLTYNDDFLYNPENGLITEYGEMTLNYKHHQDFIKRLRKSYGNGKSDIKYFAVGEYGEKSDRPHFHTIIFNAQQQNILDAWKDNGNIHFGEVTEASITYTLKYAMKKIGRVHKKGWKDKNFHREVERALISRGIGIEYSENNNNKEYYGNDINRQITSEGGKIQSLPRYYKQKFYTEAQLFARAQNNLRAMDQNTTIESIANSQALEVRNYQRTEKKQKSRKD